MYIISSVFTIEVDDTGVDCMEELKAEESDSSSDSDSFVGAVESGSQAAPVQTVADLVTLQFPASNRIGTEFPT